jgi:predicted RNase H-like HicB family nuclease
VPQPSWCISQGGDRQDAVTNTKEAIEAYVDALRDDGLPVPEDKLDAVLVAV